MATASSFCARGSGADFVRQVNSAEGLVSSFLTAAPRDGWAGWSRHSSRAYAVSQRSLTEDNLQGDEQPAFTYTQVRQGCQSMHALTYVYCIFVDSVFVHIFVGPQLEAHESTRRVSHEGMRIFEQPAACTDSAHDQRPGRNRPRNKPAMLPAVPSTFSS